MKKIFFVILLPLLLASCHRRQEDLPESKKAVTDWKYELAMDFDCMLDSMSQSEKLLFLTLYHDYTNSSCYKFDEVLYLVDSTRHDYMQLVGGVESRKNREFDESIRLLEVLEKEEKCLATAEGETTFALCKQFDGLYALQLYADGLRSSSILSIDPTFKQEMEAWWAFRREWLKYSALIGYIMYYDGSASRWSGQMATYDVGKSRSADLDAILKSLEFVDEEFNQIDKNSKIVSLSVADRDFRLTTDTVHQRLTGFIQELIDMYAGHSEDEDLSEYSLQRVEELQECLDVVNKTKNEALKQYDNWYQVRLGLNLDYSRLQETSRGVFTPVFFLNSTALLIQRLKADLESISYYLIEYKELENL